MFAAHIYIQAGKQYHTHDEEKPLKNFIAWPTWSSLHELRHGLVPIVLQLHVHQKFEVKKKGKTLTVHEISASPFS